jgi:hypothetical protein
MMNRLLQFVLVTGTIGALGAVSAAESSAQTTAGGGLVYSFETGIDLGIQVNAHVGLPDVLPGLRVGGDVTYFFPTDNFSILSFNPHAQYHFLAQDNLSAYGLAGLSIGRWSIDIDVPGLPGFATSGTETGLLLGGGVNFGLGFGLGFGELRLVTGDLDRVEIAAGIRIPIGQ